MAGLAPAMNVSDPASILALIIDSHRRVVGRPLADERLAPAAQAEWLNDDAPFGLLAHDTQPDPRFIYANLAALSCFEYPDDELIGLPSRLTAEPPDRDERQRLLDAVASDGFVDGYRGLRIAKSGRHGMDADRCRRRDARAGGRLSTLARRLNFLSHLQKKCCACETGGRSSYPTDVAPGRASA